VQMITKPSAHAVFEDTNFTNTDPITGSRPVQFAVIRGICVFVAIVAFAISCDLSTAQESSPAETSSPTPAGTAVPEATAQLSPDKRWAYQPDQSAPKIIKAGTTEVALDLSDQPAGNGFSSATVVWAPDSKRFAFNYGQGRTHATSLYQLHGSKWVALKSPGDNDEIDKAADDIVAGQLKKQGVSPKKLEKQGKYLRFIWWTAQVDRWPRPDTAVVYASLRQVVAHRDDPGDMDGGYGADLLVTLKFDAAGKWKVIKTHRMSDKEVDERYR
jgi:hypothetical protein